MEPNRDWLEAQRRADAGNPTAAKGVVGNVTAMHASTYDITQRIEKKLASGKLKGADLLPVFELNAEGDALFQAGAWPAADAKYREALGIAPNDPEIRAWLWNARGRALEQMEQVTDAKEAYEKAIEEYYNYPSPHRNLGLLYRFHLKDSGRALECFERALLIEPTRLPELYNDIGNIHREEGCTDEAERRYRDGLRIREDYYPAINNLFGLLLIRALQDAEPSLEGRIADLSEAADLIFRLFDCAPADSVEYQLALRCAPTVVDNLRAFAMHERDSKLTAAAERHYLQCVAISEFTRDTKGVYHTWNDLGVLKRNVGDLEAAEGLFQKSLDASEEHNDEYFVMLSAQNLGSVCLLRGEHTQAMAHLRRALELGDTEKWPKHRCEIHYMIATGFMARGDRDVARKHLTEAVQIADRLGKPDLQLTVRAALRQLQTEQNDPFSFVIDV